MPKRLAILYDCPYPFIKGGGQKRLFEISQYLLKHDWEVEWYALKFWEGPEKIQHKGITFNAVGRQSKLYSSDGKRRISEAIYYGAMVARHMELRQFNIILAGQWPLFHLIPARFFCLIGQAKLVVDWWEVWGRDQWLKYFGLKGLLGLLLEKIMSRITPHIIAITQKGRDQLHGLGVKKDAITFIPNGIDFEKILNSISKPKKFDLIYMGRLKGHKNLDHLIQVVSLLKKKGDSMTLQIIGDGPERNGLEALVKELNISENVVFHGEIESDIEAYSWMKTARLFVHPSTKEGGGSITVLEANACGLPVVAYRHENGIANELIDEGINGYWVEEINPKAMGEKIRQILLDESQGQKIKDNSIKNAGKHDWINIGKEYEDYFLKLLNNGRRYDQS
jgi:glycosyltransferase involved in cell wall biosynthesis